MTASTRGQTSETRDDRLESVVPRARVPLRAAMASQASDTLAQHADALIALSIEARVLLFGSYVLKSGRTSPYFFNAGLLYTGEHLYALAQAYASLIASVPAFAQAEVLFGPAYKGISLAALTAAELYRTTGRSIGFAYNRSDAPRASLR